MKTPDTATLHSVLTAQLFLDETAKQFGGSIEASSIEEIEGDLSIRWTFGDKSLILISPADDSGHIRLYRRTKIDGVPKSLYLSEAEPNNLVDGFAWITRGDVDL